MNGPRLILAPVLLPAVLTACSGHAAAAPVAAACTPPAGGRCAGDVPWPGPITLSADGTRLHGRVLCGGTLHATEQGDTVTIRLHVGAMRPGMMSCASVDVGTRLPTPLTHPEVVDATDGHRIPVDHARVG
jgi:hypothetical protein